MQHGVTLFVLLALTATACGQVTVGVTDNGDGTGTVTLDGTGASIPCVGIALIIDAFAGATSTELITDVTAPSSPFFDVYIDYAHDNPSGYAVGDGGPGASTGAAGEPNLPIAAVSISMGELNALDANSEPQPMDLAVIELDRSGDICISTDTLRGGIVDVQGGSVTLTNNGACFAIFVHLPDCMKSTAPEYAEWLALGGPDCWCYEWQCKGDADGAEEGSAFAGFKKVFNVDTTALIAAYGIKEAPKGPGILSLADGVCADFDHALEGSAFAGFKRVFNNDTTILIANYGIKEPPKGPGVPSCASTNYNFFITP